MGLLAEAADLVEVGVVHVREHAEDALEDRAHHVPEVPGEGLPEGLREDPWVVDLHAVQSWSACAGRSVGKETRCGVLYVCVQLSLLVQAAASYRCSAAALAVLWLLRLLLQANADCI